MEAIIQPSTVTPAEFLGSQILLCGFTASVIGIRLHANFNHSRKLFVDDYLCIVALVFMIWNSATFYVLVRLLNSDPETVTIEHLTRMVAVGIFASNTAMYTAKLPLLFLFIRTFGVEKWLRWTCKFLIVFSGLGFLAAAMYAGISCSPRLHTVGFPYMFQCITAVSQYSCVSRSSLSLAVDLIMFVIPLPVIKKLNLPFRRKLGLAFVFMTGLLAMVASALSLFFQVKQSGGSSSNFTNALLVTVIESCIVITVSCAPSLHLFWTKQAALRIRLGLTRLSTGLGKSRQTTSDSTTNLKEETTATGPIQVTTHHYVELRDTSSNRGPLYEARASGKPGMV